MRARGACEVEGGWPIIMPFLSCCVLAVLLGRTLAMPHTCACVCCLQALCSVRDEEGAAARAEIAHLKEDAQQEQTVSGGNRDHVWATSAVPPGVDQMCESIYVYVS